MKQQQKKRSHIYVEVRSLGLNALHKNHKLTKVTIPDKKAFFQVSRLVKVIPQIVDY